MQLNEVQLHNQREDGEGTGRAEIAGRLHGGGERDSVEESGQAICCLSSANGRLPLSIS